MKIIYLIISSILGILLVGFLVFTGLTKIKGDNSSSSSSSTASVLDDADFDPGNLKDRTKMDDFKVENYYSDVMKMAKEKNPEAELRYIVIRYSRYLGTSPEIHPDEIEFGFFKRHDDYVNDDFSIHVNHYRKMDFYESVSVPTSDDDPLEIDKVKIGNVELLEKIEKDWGAALRESNDVGRIIIKLVDRSGDEGLKYEVFYRDGFYGEGLKEMDYSVTTGEPL